MIKNDSELEVVRDMIAELTRARDSSKSNPDSTEFFRELGALGFQRKLDQLQQEVNEFEKSKKLRIAASQAFG